LERRLRTLFSSAAGFLLAASPAAAQNVSLADVLAANARCTSAAEARTSLERAIAQTPPDTTGDAIVSALRDLSSRDGLCTELKTAARSFADQAAAVDVPPKPVESPQSQEESLQSEVPSLPETHVTSASSSIVAATLAEAERRAANLKFEVAPPPRFMTKERNSGH
jgi:hypothetical protein